MNRVVLRIIDADSAPTVRLSLSDDTISETGGIATVTAELGWKSAEPTTVEVALAPEANAGMERIRLTGDTRLTIPKNAITSHGRVRVVAVNNEVDAPDATVYLVGTAHNTLGIVQPAPVPLVISDDDRVVVTLVLEPEVIAEDGGQSAVTAALDRPSSAAVTVTVTAEAAPPAPDAFTLSGSRVLTIAAGDTASAATVTITAADDSAAGDKRVLVRGSVTGGNGAPPPAVRVLTIRDDDTAPSVTLELSSHAIAEDGGSATVAAVLDYPASADTTVTVTVTPVAPAASTDFSLSANPVLAIAAGATASSGGVTITAVDNNLVTAHKQFRVGASVTGGDGAAAPPPVTLVIEDDEAPPVLALTLTPASIAEAAGVSTVTATLDRALGAQRTVTISAAARPPAQDTAFTQSGTVLTFPAGSTTSTGLVTITAEDDRDWVDWARGSRCRHRRTASAPRGRRRLPSPYRRTTSTACTYRCTETTCPYTGT